MTIKQYVSLNARISAEEYKKIVEPAQKTGYTIRALIIEGAKSFMEIDHKVEVKK